MRRFTLLATLLSLAITLLPATLYAGTDARNEGRARVYGQGTYQQPVYRGHNYQSRTAGEKSHYQSGRGYPSDQSYQLASSGKRWEDMNPREQEQIRQRKERYDSLPSGEKQRIREARERYERMPPDRKEQIRERWEKMPADKKERYRLEKRER